MRRPFVLGGLFLVVSVFGGCASAYRDLRTTQSEGLTGCLKDEMAFTDRSPAVRAEGTSQWTIECRDKTFLCSQTGKGSAACHER